MIEKIQFIPKDFKESLNDMPYESVGRLFMALIAFAEDEDPTPILEDDLVSKTLFPVLKQQVIRWDGFRRSKVESGRSGGKKGGAPIGNQNASKTNQNKAKQTKTKQNKATNNQIPNTNNQIPNINNNIVRVIDPREEIVEDIVAYLNQAAGTHYRTGKDVTKLIHGRLNEGFTADDFKKVIDKKVKKWGKDPKMSLYIRPSTLFAPSHFNEYLNEPDETAVKAADDDMLRRWAEGG